MGIVSGLLILFIICPVASYWCFVSCRLMLHLQVVHDTIRCDVK